MLRLYDIPPSTLYVVLRGALWLLGAMVYSIEMVYLAVIVQFNPFQLVLVGVLGQAISFLLEAPTGALADLYSRRWAVIVGVALEGVGCLLEGAIPLVATVLLAVAVRGFGATMRSGADIAWIADEMISEKPAKVSALFLRAEQLGLVASLLGVGGAAVLASIRLNLSIIVAGALSLVLATDAGTRTGLVVAALTLLPALPLCALAQRSRPRSRMEKVDESNRLESQGAG